jgi:prepilin-type N-terminal cleavage/methylation domain-containing protein/prepilin-type processing-associated H-X9-DG protein
MEARMYLYRKAGPTTHVSVRHGFTLAEMLVVVAILGVLMSLLIPAITAARDSARRADCASRMGQLGKAVQGYDLAKDGFPGYLEYTGGGPGGIGGYYTNWVIMTLPYLGRPDILNAWRDASKTSGLWLNGTATSNYANYRLGLQMSVPKLSELICPSDQQPEQCPLSFVANCGMADLAPTNTMQTPPDWAANGPFHNHYFVGSTTTVGVPPNLQVRMSAADIKNGSSSTLMLSENVQAGQWTEPYNPDSNLSTFATNYMTVEVLTGMVFGPPGNTSTANPPTPRAINDSVLRDSTTGALVLSRPNPATAGVGYAYARPSSLHKGGVNVVFCDGHSRFLRQNINPLVFAAIMTTDRVNCSSPGKAVTSDNSVISIRTQQINETDFR